MAAVRGQDSAIASIAQGLRQHSNILLLGPPNTCQTMLARRIPGLLPPLTAHARSWLTAEYVGLGVLSPGDPDLTERPFRAPHHTVSAAALCGVRWMLHEPRAAACSCKRMLPAHPYHNLPPAIVSHAGELQLARFGVLYLDELTEFHRATVAELGQAWRAMSDETRPLLVASAKPCPCGWADRPERECVCSNASIERQRDRITEFSAALGIEITAAVR